MFNIIFIIGGPGVGKGTQCSLLVKEWPTKFVQISLGDILRDEQDKPDSKWRETLQKNLKEGLIGSKEMVVDLLQDKLEELNEQDKHKVILLDGKPDWYLMIGDNDNVTGFPRTINRCVLFEERICKPAGCVLLKASEDILRQRLRGGARDDDHKSTVDKRLEVWQQESGEVVEHYRSQGLLVEVDAEGEKGEVLRELEKELAKKVRVVGFFLIGRGRSRSAGEEDGKEVADGDSLSRRVTPG